MVPKRLTVWRENLTFFFKNSLKKTQNDGQLSTFILKIGIIFFSFVLHCNFVECLKKSIFYGRSSLRGINQSDFLLRSPITPYNLYPWHYQFTIYSTQSNPVSPLSPASTVSAVYSAVLPPSLTVFFCMKSNCKQQV